MPKEPAKSATPAAPDEFADFRHPDEASFDKLVRSIDRAYHRPFVMMGRSFLQGMMAALGATVGLAIVITVLSFTLKALGGIDYFEPGIQKIQNVVIPQEFREAVSELPDDRSR